MPKACNFITKETLAQVFSSDFCQISKNTFFKKTPLVAASDVTNAFNKIRNHPSIMVIKNDQSFAFGPVTHDYVIKKIKNS